MALDEFDLKHKERVGMRDLASAQTPDVPCCFGKTHGQLHKQPTQTSVLQHSALPDLV